MSEEKEIPNCWRILAIVVGVGVAMLWYAGGEKGEAIVISLIVYSLIITVGASQMR